MLPDLDSPQDFRDVTCRRRAVIAMAALNTRCQNPPYGRVKPTMKL